MFDILLFESIFSNQKKALPMRGSKHQVSITAVTIHSTKLPLVSWFLGIDLVAADKGSFLALPLPKHLDIAGEKLDGECVKDTNRYS